MKNADHRFVCLPTSVNDSLQPPGSNAHPLNSHHAGTRWTVPFHEWLVQQPERDVGDDMNHLKTVSIVSCRKHR
jgi:hypothetical protein